jgi:hypothetical protein
MTRAQFVGIWSKKAEEWKRFSVQVEGAKLVEAILTDLDAVFSFEHDEVLTLRTASELSGYTVDHLGREVRAGRIPNAGSKQRPRILRGHLPTKAQRLQREAE